MTFLLAFLLGGALCALAQAVFVLAKFPNPVPCLILFFCVGGVLGVFGVVPMLEELCQAGMMATVLDPGFGIQAGVFSAMGGDPKALVALLATIVTMIAMGLVTGAIASSRAARK